MICCVYQTKVKQKYIKACCIWFSFPRALAVLGRRASCVVRSVKFGVPAYWMAGGKCCMLLSAAAEVWAQGMQLFMVNLPLLMRTHC